MIPIPQLCIQYGVMGLLVIGALVFAGLCIWNKAIKNGTSFKVKVYVWLLICTTFFVVWNWDYCVNMQFFDSFNGYNIVFIVWIVLILLSVFDIKFTGITSIDFNKAIQAAEDATEAQRREVLRQSQSEEEGEHV